MRECQASIHAVASGGAYESPAVGTASFVEHFPSPSCLQSYDRSYHTLRGQAEDEGRSRKRSLTFWDTNSPRRRPLLTIPLCRRNSWCRASSSRLLQRPYGSVFCYASLRKAVVMWFPAYYYGYNQSIIWIINEFHQFKFEPPMVKSFSKLVGRKHKSHYKSKERWRIIKNMQQDPVWSIMKNRHILPYVHTRRVYTSAMNPMW